MTPIERALQWWNDLQLSGKVGVVALGLLSTAVMAWTIRYDQEQLALESAERSTTTFAAPTTTSPPTTDPRPTVDADFSPEGGDGDVELVNCRRDVRSETKMVVEVRVTNVNEEPLDYIVRVDFIGPDGLITHRTYAMFGDIAPGQRARQLTSSFPGPGELDCEVGAVSRFSAS